MNPEDIIVVGTNSSRQATDEEVEKDFGMVKCEGGDCELKMRELGIESIDMMDFTPVALPVGVPATATAHEETRATETSGDKVMPGNGSVGDLSLPRETSRSERGL